MPRSGRRPRGYFRRHIWPRRKEIIFHRNVYWAIIVGSAFTLLNTFFGGRLGFEDVQFSSVTEPIIAFAALSFGGCITGSTVAIALPNDRLLATMSLNGRTAHGNDKKKIRIKRATDGQFTALDDDGEQPKNTDYPVGFRSHYKELVFTFTYSAVVQLALVVVSVLVFLVKGDDMLFIESQCSFITRLSLFVISTFFTYSLLQLVASIEALVGVGNLRDTYVRADYLSSG